MRHRVPGIDDEVEDGGIELRRIDEAGGQIGCKRQLNLHSRPCAVFEKGLELMKQRVHVLGARDRVLLTRKTQEARRHPITALDAFVDGGQSRLEFVRVAGISLGDPQPAGDNGEDVPKIVRDAAGHFTECTHLLSREFAAFPSEFSIDARSNSLW